MPRPCIVVAGMGRCVTSLTMQMLHAAGVPCIGEWPAFETEASGVGSFRSDRFAALSETAIKLIDPANLPVGDMPNHIVVWLDRNPREQAKSQVKLLRQMGIRLPRHSVRAFEDDIRKSRAKHRARGGIPGGCPFINLRFEDLIVIPQVETPRLAGFLAEHGYSVSAEVMAKQVRRRSVGCLPGFLEAELLAERESAL